MRLFWKNYDATFSKFGQICISTLKRSTCREGNFSFAGQVFYSKKSWNTK